jgi:hypothetical protein
LIDHVVAIDVSGQESNVWLCTGPTGGDGG